MIKITIVFAVLLIALGVGAFVFSASPTALLPAYVGGTLLLIGGFALGFASARKYLMHVAVLVALLGALAPAAALVIRAAQMSPLALAVNVGMLALCATLVVLQIRSFVQTRRDRAAAANAKV